MTVIDDRLSFQRRPDSGNRVRLILRHAAGTPAIARRIQQAQIAAGLPGEPAANITVGHYLLLLDPPPPRWGFAPAPTPAARALLGVWAVRARICEDLAGYMDHQAPRTVRCPRCEHEVLPVQDGPDLLCPVHRGLVL